MRGEVSWGIMGFVGRPGVLLVALVVICVLIVSGSCRVRARGFEKHPGGNPGLKVPYSLPDPTYNALAEMPDTSKTT